MEDGKEVFGVLLRFVNHMSQNGNGFTPPFEAT